MRSKLNLILSTVVLVVLGLCGSTLIADVNEGLISHWRFDEGSGSIAYDSAGTNDGTIYGAAWTTGQINNALSFDGSNDYVSVPHDNELNITGDITIAAWVRFTQGGSSQGIVTKCLANGAQNSPYHFRATYLAQPSLAFVRADASAHERVYSDLHMPLRQWLHVLVRVENKVPDFYVDGIITGKGSDVVFTRTPTGNTKPVLIGRRDDGLYFDGLIDDVRIYDRALSEEEILELYAPSDTGPIAHWKFDEGSGSIAYDSAGTNDGTVNGATWTTGQINGALSFDGVNDYVEVSDDSSLRFGQYDSFSISLWAKPVLGGFLFSKMRAFAQYGVFGYELRWAGPDKFDLVIEKSGVANVFAGTSNNSAPPGRWYHVTTVYDNKDMKIYLDGELRGTNFFNYDTGNTTPDKNLAIGVRSYDSTLQGYFNGNIDEVAIYNRALSAEEVQQLYESGLPILVVVDIKPGSCPNPLNVTSRGVLPVAVLGSEDFDVDSVDIASIRLAGVAPIRSSYEDVATPVSDSNECECSTEGPDGFLDLTLKFEPQRIVETFGEVNDGDELVLELTGVLSDETHIEGSDCVIIRGRHKPLNRADFNGDGTVDMADFAAFAENWLQSSIVEY